jgi:glycopeptide antibiotics resistance protein
MPAVSARYNFQTLVWQRRCAWMLMAVIAYGSLFPLDWDFDAPNRFGWFEHAGRLDILKNMALFFPVGLLVGVMGMQSSSRAAHLARWSAGAFTLATLLQIAQIYLPREPEAADVLTNMTGFAIGYAVQPWFARIHASVHQAGRIAGNDPFLLVLVVIWLLASMFPFLPVWRGDMLREQIEELLRLEWNKPRQLAMHACMTYIGVCALYWTIQPLPRLGRYAGLAVGFALIAALEAKVFGFSQSPSLASIIGMILGVTAWLVVRQKAALRWQVIALGLAGLLLYLIYAALPLTFRDPVFFRWWPFGSLLGGNLSVALRSYCAEALGLGACMWALTQLGMRPGQVIAAAASLGFAVEWLQRYLQYRTPEIGTVVMVLLLGFLLGVCRRREESDEPALAMAAAR